MLGRALVAIQPPPPSPRHAPAGRSRPCRLLCCPTQPYRPAAAATDIPSLVARPGQSQFPYPSYLPLPSPPARARTRMFWRGGGCKPVPLTVSRCCTCPSSSLAKPVAFTSSQLPLAAMISQFFILTPRGDTIVSRDYRGDVVRGTSACLILCSCPCPCPWLPLLLRFASRLALPLGVAGRSMASM